MSIESVNTSLVNSRISCLKFGHFEPKNLKCKTASDEQQVISTICVIVTKKGSVKSIFFQLLLHTFCPVLSDRRS